MGVKRLQCRVLMIQMSSETQRKWVDSTITEQLIWPAAQTLGAELHIIESFRPTSEPVTPLALVGFWEV